MQMNSKKKLYNAAFSAQLPCLGRHSLKEITYMVPHSVVRLRIAVGWGYVRDTVHVRFIHLYNLKGLYSVHIVLKLFSMFRVN